MEPHSRHTCYSGDNTYIQNGVTYVHNGDVYDESIHVHGRYRRRRTRFEHASYWIFMVWFEACFWAIFGSLWLMVMGTLALGRLAGVPILVHRHGGTWGEELRDAGLFITDAARTLSLRRSRV